MVMAQYMRRVVPGRVTLAAEYQAALLSPENSQVRTFSYADEKSLSTKIGHVQIFCALF